MSHSLVFGKIFGGYSTQKKDLPELYTMCLCTVEVSVFLFGCSLLKDEVPWALAELTVMDVVGETLSASAFQTGFEANSQCVHGVVKRLIPTRNLLLSLASVDTYSSSRRKSYSSLGA
jgi:hypothetical protein